MTAFYNPWLLCQPHLNLSEEHISMVTRLLPDIQGYCKYLEGSVLLSQNTSSAHTQTVCGISSCWWVTHSWSPVPMAFSNRNPWISGCDLQTGWYDVYEVPVNLSVGFLARLNDVEVWVQGAGWTTHPVRNTWLYWDAAPKGLLEALISRVMIHEWHLIWKDARTFTFLADALIQSDLQYDADILFC